MPNQPIQVIAKLLKEMYPQNPEYRCAHCGQVTGPDGHGPGHGVGEDGRPRLWCEVEGVPPYHRDDSLLSILPSGTGRWAMRIRPDGTIEIGDGYSPTEAGEAFLTGLAQLGVTVVRSSPGGV